MPTHHGRGQGRRLTQIDHLITTHYHGDHFGAHGGARRPDSDPHFIDHGANVQPSRRDRRRSFRDSIRRCTRSEAHRRQAWRPVGRRSRCADRRLGRPGVKTRSRAPASRIRYCAAYKPQDADPTRERAVGRQPCHLREVPRAAPRRPDVEQGIRADVPEQSARHRRSLHRVASRAGHFELSGARSRACAARGHHEQRHPQGRTARRDESFIRRRGSRICGRCTSRS